jgi:zinc protease
MESEITKTNLPNGLTILLKEIHTAPIISSWVWYRVGSRNEPQGLTGVSHWVEHMQFKGTSQFPGGILDKAISREGGSWNAFTYLDWTTFFETMPADKIDLALRLEADRMVNSHFDPEEVSSERTVIISEREGNENEPMFKLSEAIQSEAFQVHAYHHEVIGDMADLHSMQRDDLYNHYQNYYSPNNALVAVAGDFNTQQMLDRIQELYAPIPGHPTRVFTPPGEPAMEAEKRLEVSGPGETMYLQMAFRAPAGSDPDFFPLTVLDSLLTGPSSLNMFGGGGISNRTSRLYRALVEKELAVGVSGGAQATIDPFLHFITLVVHPQSTVEAAVAALDEEIARLQAAPPEPAELERAVKQARALFAYGSESITNQAFWLGFAEMFATYDWFTTYLDRLAAVTPEDVQRVAQQYLRPQQRVLGIYQPTGEMAEEGELEVEDDD